MTTPQTPYVPFVPLHAIPGLLSSVVQVIRASTTLTTSGDAAGTLTVAWSPLQAVLDPEFSVPGIMRCRLDMQFIRRGVDQPAPMIAGKAPDRTGVVFYHPVVDPLTGIPLVQAGDRLVTIPDPVSGRMPVYGTFEIRQRPDVAQDYIGGHHIETQIVEVSESLQPGSITPFPGVGGSV